MNLVQIYGSSVIVKHSIYDMQTFSIKLFKVYFFIIISVYEFFIKSKILYEFCSIFLNLFGAKISTYFS